MCGFPTVDETRNDYCSVSVPDRVSVRVEPVPHASIFIRNSHPRNYSVKNHE